MNKKFYMIVIIAIQSSLLQSNCFTKILLYLKSKKIHPQEENYSSITTNTKSIFLLNDQITAFNNKLFELKNQNNTNDEQLKQAITLGRKIVENNKNILLDHQKKQIQQIEKIINLFEEKLKKNKQEENSLQSTRCNFLQSKNQSQ